MKIGITGAAGGLGRRATEVLGENHELILIDNVDPAQATVFDGKPPTFRSLKPFEPTWPYKRVDIMSLDDVVAALTGVDVVVHLAGWPTGSWSDALSTMQTNVMGTFTVYEAARRKDVRRVINASSINAFGSIYWRVQESRPIRSRLPLVEDDPRVPEDPYSLSKAITEDIGWAYRRAFGIEAVNLRFAAVWRESHYQEAMRDGLPQSQSWADDLWGWVHVQDWMQCIAAAANVADPTSEPITVGAPDTKAPENTLDLIRKFRPEFQHELREPLPGRSPLLSITRARSFLGYKPSHTLADAPIRESQLKSPA